MTIPFVIDNQQHKMADVLNALLADHKGHSLDIAAAYFNVSGWQLLHDALNGLSNFRLLLGDEPEVGSDLGLREVGAKPIKGLIDDLEATYGGIYDKLVNRIEGLKLAPYRLETHKKQGVARDQFEEGREEALIEIFKSRYLKRFESSVDAFRISVRRALEFLNFTLTAPRIMLVCVAAKDVHQG